MCSQIIFVFTHYHRTVSCRVRYYSHGELVVLFHMRSICVLQTTFVFADRHGTLWCEIDHYLYGSLPCCFTLEACMFTVHICVHGSHFCSQIVMGLCRVGFVTTYMGDSLVSGFTTGAAVHVFTSQVKYALGLKIPRFENLFQIIKVRTGQINANNISKTVCWKNNL